MSAAPSKLDATVPLLKAVGLTKRFPGVIANDHVDLEIMSGEIHAVLGENGAGKSTLMHMIGGLMRPDQGELRWRGKPVQITSPREALKLGIGIVHQHFMLVPRLTVLENVTLGMGSLPGGMRAAEVRLRQLAEDFGMEVDPRRPLETLSVGERQKVEILKALFREVCLLVLDEPTASLAPLESERLFALGRRLAQRGGAVIFITHRLEEVRTFCDRATVLRGGRNVGTFSSKESTVSGLASLMIGAEPTVLPERAESQAGTICLEMKGVGTFAHLGSVALSGIALSVRSGEIVGIAGVDGNGQAELAEALLGLRAIERGDIAICGADIARLDTAEILARGVGVIPGDRHDEAILEAADLVWNALLGPAPGKPLVSRGLMNWPEVRRRAADIVDELRVKTPSLNTPISALSGGHQQRFVLGRVLRNDVRLLVAVQPTRGLDLESATLIRRRLLALRAAGCAILLIAMDLDEIMMLSDRIAVLYGGAIAGWGTTTSSRASLGLLMAGVRAEDPENG